MKNLMKTLFTILFLFLFSINLLAQTNIANLEPSEYFDFWIGTWELTWQTKDNKIGKAENVVHKIMNDKVIQENFNVIDDISIEGFKGKSWSVYNKNNGIWYQTWVDNQGAYLDFLGEFDGEKRIFKREFANKDGNIIIQRMVFYNISKDSFTWDWENSLDDGNTWNLLWRIEYKRKGAI